MQFARFLYICTGHTEPVVQWSANEFILLNKIYKIIIEFNVVYWYTLCDVDGIHIYIYRKCAQS